MVHCFLVPMFYMISWTMKQNEINVDSSKIQSIMIIIAYPKVFWHACFFSWWCLRGLAHYGVQTPPLLIIRVCCDVRIIGTRTCKSLSTSHMRVGRLSRAIYTDEIDWQLSNSDSFSLRIPKAIRKSTSNPSTRNKSQTLNSVYTSISYCFAGITYRDLPRSADNQ